MSTLGSLWKSLRFCQEHNCWLAPDAAQVPLLRILERRGLVEIKTDPYFIARLITPAR